LDRGRGHIGYDQDRGDLLDRRGKVREDAGGIGGVEGQGQGQDHVGPGVEQVFRQDIPIDVTDIGDRFGVDISPGDVVAVRMR
jgi:hypothetical protein